MKDPPLPLRFFSLFIFMFMFKSFLPDQPDTMSWTWGSPDMVQVGRLIPVWYELATLILPILFYGLIISLSLSYALALTNLLYGRSSLHVVIQLSFVSWNMTWCLSCLAGRLMVWMELLPYFCHPSAIYLAPHFHLPTVLMCLQ